MKAWPAEFETCRPPYVEASWGNSVEPVQCRLCPDQREAGLVGR
jgi:hypothetical protein